jgi:hypothetical protein
VILARKFVFIHLPKTGGTFVTDVLKRVLRPPRKGNFLERLGRRFGEPVMADVLKHGTLRDVPESHRDRPVLSVIRNPYDRLVSIYHFDWWKTTPPPWVDFRELKRRHPAWPEVPFEEFVEGFQLFRKLKAPNLPPEKQPGTMSEQFVRYYFRDPEGGFPRIDDAYIAARGWEKDMFPVKFLRMERLNDDLHDALLAMGHPAEELAFIPCLGRIVPPKSKRGKGARWEDAYTPELKAKVRERERLLFAMFPEYDR